MHIYFGTSLYIILIVCFSDCKCDDSSEESLISDRVVDLNDELDLYLQPDDVDSGSYDKIFYQKPSNVSKNSVDISGSLCARNCDGIPRTCYYKFKVEHYSTMGYACGNCSCTYYSGCSNPHQCNNDHCITGNTNPRNMITVNKRYPGPPIYVCKGDRVVVDVTNLLQGKTVTLHWHGIFQKGTPWMDGVTMLSQCPVLSGTTFRYNFIASEPGTHFWHDHAGLIKMDGVQGPLIVRQPDFEIPNSAYYDYDLPTHTIFLTDWKDFMSDDEFPDMKTLPSGRRISSLLINGKGFNMNPYFSYNTRTPMAKFDVVLGHSYRFRVIGALCMMCAVELLIEDHELNVIAVDGNPVLPASVSSVVISSGERVDIVVNAFKPRSSYLIYVRGIPPCQSTMQVGLLKYEGASDRTYYRTPPPLLRTLNHPNFTLSQPTNIMMSRLMSNDPPPTYITNPTTTSKFTFVLSSYSYSVEEFVEGQAPLFFKPFGNLPPFRSTINGLTSSAPSVPLYSQFLEASSKQFCSPQCLNGTTEKPCEPCVHLVKIPLNRTVDFIIADPVNYTGIVHPFHLHGHKFYVLEQGNMGGNVTVQSLLDKLETGGIRVMRPPIKDTIIVPLGSYAIIRFFTDNPGVWIFHCHYIYHNAVGMHVFLQVGEYQDFPSPPINWPKCGNYLPPI